MEITWCFVHSQQSVIARSTMCTVHCNVYTSAREPSRKGGLLCTAQQTVISRALPTTFFCSIMGDILNELLNAINNSFWQHENRFVKHFIVWSKKSTQKRDTLQNKHLLMEPHFLFISVSWRTPESCIWGNQRVRRWSVYFCNGMASNLVHTLI